MDPEDLRELISAYHKCVAETVRRHPFGIAGSLSVSLAASSVTTASR
jgi:hypothetical protein